MTRVTRTLLIVLIAGATVLGAAGGAPSVDPSARRSGGRSRGRARAEWSAIDTQAPSPANVSRLELAWTFAPDGLARTSSRWLWPPIVHAGPVMRAPYVYTAVASAANACTPSTWRRARFAGRRASVASQALSPTATCCCSATTAGCGATSRARAISSGGDLHGSIVRNARDAGGRRRHLVRVWGRVRGGVGRADGEAPLAAPTSPASTVTSPPRADVSSRQVSPTRATRSRVGIETASRARRQDGQDGLVEADGRRLHDRGDSVIAGGKVFVRSMGGSEKRRVFSIEAFRRRGREARLHAPVGDAGGFWFDGARGRRISSWSIRPRTIPVRARRSHGYAALANQDRVHSGRTGNRQRPRVGRDEQQRLVALDARNGRPLWHSEPFTLDTEGTPGQTSRRARRRGQVRPGRDRR